ncbi:FSH1-domain-containing protein [Desarmillaria tabescens]|uniref:FSH1-domain-containing protein n=1 Tax=Armillaria tabescens TaxID=1929756 RepID=A0AA39KEH1_ARMTA|nr:FSH1-domain-containing protein [Desarmillaria tabescens]KAK0457318.1 FSH1-domain-containing protein [Desarmillaria tabescens]
MPRSILVLHGYAQNATIFSKRLGAFRKQCGKDIELVFVDAPHIIQPADLRVNGSQTELGAFDPADGQPRRWYDVYRDLTRAIGLEESLMILRDILKQRKFDGVFGFSQGAAIAAFLSALLEKPQSYPPFLVDGKSPHPPFQFCVCIAGYRITDPLADLVFNPTYTTLTLHVIGKNDIVVLEEWTKVLLGVSANKRVEEHDGGHFIPSKTSWRKFLVAYLLDPRGDIPSPGRGSVSSTPNSGRATPVIF